MEKSMVKQCKHIIKDKYYCAKCGTLFYNKVSLNNL